MMLEKLVSGSGFVFSGVLPRTSASFFDIFSKGADYRSGTCCYAAPTLCVLSAPCKTALFQDIWHSVNPEIQPLPFLKAVIA